MTGVPSADFEALPAAAFGCIAAIRMRMALPASSELLPRRPTQCLHDKKTETAYTRERINR